MGHDDFFEHGRRKHREYRDDHHDRDHRHYGDRYLDHDHGKSYGHDHELPDLSQLKYIAGKILRNKFLLTVLVIIVLIVLVGTIWLIFLLLPVLGKVFDFIIKNGLTGIYDYLLKILNQFLKGTGG